jgi:hypothetical protein
VFSRRFTGETSSEHRFVWDRPYRAISGTVYTARKCITITIANVAVSSGITNITHPDYSYSSELR